MIARPHTDYEAKMRPISMYLCLFCFVFFSHVQLHECMHGVGGDLILTKVVF